MTHPVEKDAARQSLPTVRVVRTGHGEFYACCTDAVWLYPTNRRTASEEYRSCNWYGAWRDTEQAAKSDAARHRRAHRATYVLSPGSGRTDSEAGQ